MVTSSWVGLCMVSIFGLVHRTQSSTELTVKWSQVTQLCPTLCNPMDCSLPGSSVHGIFQARVLEWVAISFSRGSSWPRDWTRISCIAGRRFTVWATRAHRRQQTIFIHLFSVVLGLPCCAQTFSCYSKRGPLSSCGAQALKHRLQKFWLLGSAVVAHRLSYPEACGIFLDQG